MKRVEKTVFISYRRTNFPWALAIFQDLTHHGYDAFFDYTSIASGDFERNILENVTARAHFVVLLTPSALEHCADPEDWLRREIEAALNSQRNIVPLTLEGFSFGTPEIAQQLIGALAPLKRYNALRIVPEYSLQAFEDLRNKFLNVPLDAVLHPASPSAQRAAAEQKAAADAAPPVQKEELTAQQWFERGFAATDPDDELHFFSEAIRLKPDYAYALYNRGVVRYTKGDLDGALKDYTEAIRLKPDYAYAFSNRGIARRRKGDLDGAQRDYDEAIRLKPDYADAFNNRGIVRRQKEDFDGAQRDYDEAIRLNPDFTEAFNNRGVLRYAKGDLDGALQDCSDAIRLKPDLGEAFYYRSIARRAKGDVNGAQQDYEEAVQLGFKPTR
ncbi:MAG: tetratricopeptide repeat protein [Bryobacteraceae bacterium]